MSVEDPSSPATPASGVSMSGAGEMAAPPSAGYPVQLEAQQPPERNRALALLRCWYVPFLNLAAVIAILPHIIVLLFLEIGMFVVWIISWFTVLFTRQIPQGMFDYQVGVLRWYMRVSAWMLLLTDDYPPFTFEEAAHPVRLSAVYPPEGIPRWRGIPLLSAIMAIPVMIVAQVILFVSWLMMIIPPIIPGLIPLFVLFGGQVPEGIYNFVRGGLRLAVRAESYALMLVRPYPTFDF